LSFFIAIVGLGFLVLVHEAGHFFASLAVGLRPRRFYLGFPPAVVKMKRRASSTAWGRFRSEAS
jgi:regulator of sigma E protease